MTDHINSEYLREKSHKARLAKMKAEEDKKKSEYDEVLKECLEIADKCADNGEDEGRYITYKKFVEDPELVKELARRGIRARWYEQTRGDCWWDCEHEHHVGYKLFWGDISNAATNGK